MSLHGCAFRKLTSLGVFVLFCLASSSAYSGEQESVAFRALIDDLRSEDIRELAREKHPDLFVRDTEKAEKAADFFYDLKATYVLMEALDHVNPRVQEHAARLLVEIVTANDVQMVQELMPRLKNAQCLRGGGAEIQIPLREYRVALVKVLVKVTGINVADMDPREPSDLEKIGNAVALWLKEHEVTDGGLQKDAGPEK